MISIIENLPQSWAEIELIKCFSDSIGGANILSSEYSESGTPVILKSDVQPMCATTQPTKFVPSKIISKKYPSRAVAQNDLLLCMRDLSQKAQILGLISTCTEEQVGHLVAQGVTLLRDCLIDRKYISYFSNTKNYRDYIFRVKRGSTQVHLGNDDIFLLALPLPPIGEQKRIVAKIDSTQEKIKTIEDSVSKAEDLIGKYRESLLQKAFRGQLVPQDPKDEPASELLKRIRAEHDQATDGKKKKKEDLPPISEEEIPFEIPKGWEAVRLIEIIEESLIGLVRSSDEQGDHHPYEYLKMGDYDEFGNFKLNSLAKVKASKTEIDQYCLQKNDFIFNTRNSDKLVGKVALISSSPSTTTLFNNNLMRIRFHTVESEFIFWQFQSSFVKNQLNRMKSGTTSVAAVYGRDLFNLVILVAPLGEQRRITEQISNLRNKVNFHKEIFTELKEKVSNLNDSILEGAFSGKLVPQNSSEGTGYDLLEKIKLSAPITETKPLMKTITSKKKLARSLKKKVKK